MREYTTLDKIGHILRQWYGEAVKCSYVYIERTNDWHKVRVSVENAVDELFFVSDDLIKLSDKMGASTPIPNIRTEVVRTKGILDRWDLVVERWSKGEIIPSELSTKLTYRRFFALDNLPIRKL